MPRHSDDSRWAPEITRKICRSCTAICCLDSQTFVVLDREEVERKLSQYRYERRNVGPLPGTLFERPILKKRKDGSCVYFDRKTHKCTIYKRRPAACRAWFCGKGTVRNMTWLALKESHNGRA